MTGRNLAPTDRFPPVTVLASNPVAAIALEDDRGPFSALPMMPGRPF